jgi:hypothetical protein
MPLMGRKFGALTDIAGWVEKVKIKCVSLGFVMRDENVSVHLKILFYIALTLLTFDRLDPAFAGCNS